jgi:protein-S-isoprenylcysteine O-methyltransferase Ste14
MTRTPIWISGILWIVFFLYWSAAAANAAPTVRSESPGSRLLHQLFLYGSLALAFVRFPPLDWRLFPYSPWVVGAGLAIQTASFLLAVWARRHLGRNWSAAVTAKADHRLVRTGPYRRVRHPIYSAMLGMFLGTALVSGEWHAFAALALIGLAYVRKIRLEEQNLRELFGADFDDYRRGTWAVLPGLL